MANGDGWGGGDTEEAGEEPVAGVHADEYVEARFVPPTEDMTLQ